MSNHNRVQIQIKLLEIKLNKFTLYEQEIRASDPYNYARIQDCQQMQANLKTKITYWTSMLSDPAV